MVKFVEKQLLNSNIGIKCCIFISNVKIMIFIIPIYLSNLDIRPGEVICHLKYASKLGSFLETICLFQDNLLCLKKDIKIIEGIFILLIEFCIIFGFVQLSLSVSK